MNYLVWGESDDSADDLKAKNIKQTELLVDMRTAIMQIGRHFQSLDPENQNIVSYQLIVHTEA